MNRRKELERVRRDIARAGKQIDILRDELFTYPCADPEGRSATAATLLNAWIELRYAHQVVCGCLWELGDA